MSQLFQRHFPRENPPTSTNYIGIWTRRSYVIVKCSIQTNELDLVDHLTRTGVLNYFCWRAIKGQRQLKDRCMRAKWTPFPYVLLCFWSWQRAKQEWSAVRIWPTGRHLRRPGLEDRRSWVQILDGRAFCFCFCFCLFCFLFC